MEEFKCLFCGGTEMSILKMHTRDSNNKVVFCRDCGLQQLFPLPTISEDQEYYDKNIHDSITTPQYDIEQIYQKFLFQNQYRVDYLLKLELIRHSDKILDFASGYGFLMQLLLQENYQVDGLEISQDRLDVSKKRLPNAKIYTNNLLMEDVPESLKEKYDVITMFHILEHIVEPKKMLRKIKEMLVPGGRLVIEVPNVHNIMMDISPEFNDFFYIRDHVAYYTPELLNTVLEETGFQVLQQGGAQMYGIENHMNWIINKGPQLLKPSYKTNSHLLWLDDIYKNRLNNELKSEYIYIIATIK